MTTYELSTEQCSTRGLVFRQGRRVFYTPTQTEFSMAGTDREGRFMLMLPREYRRYMSGELSAEETTFFLL